MKLLDLTCTDAAWNVAVDESLLDEAESNPDTGDILRLWEPPAPFVVVGRSSRVAEEVNREACERRGVPIIRRSSGGAAVVAGPGCLMYSVVLRFDRHPAIRMIETAHRFVLETVARGIAACGVDVSLRGTSDLAWGDRKVSGNSLRCRRDALLYHGTLLYEFPLDRIPELLKTPPRQPEYRAGRPHADFIANLPVDRESLRSALLDAWQVDGELTNWPESLAARLVAERFSQAAWNFRL